MSLIALSYPELTPEDFAWIENVREAHEKNYSIVRPHFTLVFGTEGISQDDFTDHVGNIARKTHIIRFVLRSTVIVTDKSEALTFVLLVPEEGHSKIARLHDRLYTGILEGNQRLDMPYIPHVTVGNSPNPQECVNLANRLNDKEFAVEGTISSIDIALYEEGGIDCVGNVELTHQ
ncbi:MAG: 2'-5' RNA ligase family protein [candidate division Zixibacteria bacterium]|nr:2'-5' RNA ligase family protein [candidate division Zixibacteria bacterium]MBU1470400.1 2'-5' RNA ligase family protein [candidate division Zixibacteria bacterium]MBU2624296.1 2'-5' RNA ligase family protein [candidate division Zixibacteria bacterium]